MFYALTTSLLCFFGDGSPLSDRCFVTPWEVDTIYECRTVGESTPPEINTGDRNPGMGMVIFGVREGAYQTGEFREVGRAAYYGRGYSSFRPDDALVYIVDGDLMMVDGMEECDLLEGHE